MMIKVTVPAPPFGKERPRVCKGIAYSPQKTRDYEKLVRQCYLSSGGKIEMFKGPVAIIIYAVFGIPKSTPKSKRQEMLEGKIRPTKRPDWDNIGKIVCDALNGYAYHDDSQIVYAVVRKEYGQIPKVIVNISGSVD